MTDIVKAALKSERRNLKWTRIDIEEIEIKLKKLTKDLKACKLEESNILKRIEGLKENR